MRTIRDETLLVQGVFRGAGLLLGQLADEIRFAVDGDMDVFDRPVVAEVGPVLNVGRIAGQRLKDDSVPAVGGLGETEPDIDSQDLLHGSPPSGASR
jgi:hypothetical protein